MRTRKNIFVTGRPGCGKTTLIERVVGSIDADVGGFYTTEVREEGARVGFDIVTPTGERGVLARVGLDSPCRVGRYGVHRDDLERVGVRALLRAIQESPLIVMDEIGRMELYSVAFQAAVLRALDAPVPVLGTIQDRHNAFLACVRSRRDVEILRVDEGNRDELVSVVRAKIEELLAEGASGTGREGEGGV